LSSCCVCSVHNWMYFRTKGREGRKGCKEYRKAKQCKGDSDGLRLKNLAKIKPPSFPHIQILMFYLFISGQSLSLYNKLRIQSLPSSVLFFLFLYCGVRVWWRIWLQWYHLSYSSVHTNPDMLPVILGRFG
jgi:hypothetical protein